MPNLNEIQNEIKNLRNAKNNLNDELVKARAKLDYVTQSIQNKLKGLNPQKRAAVLAEAELQKQQIQHQIADFKNQKVNLNDSYNLFLANRLVQHEPDKLTEKLNDAYPILMFPLRLETRFKKWNGQDHLWLRVYPDDCNVNKNENLVSVSEYEVIRQFWVDVFKSGKNTTQEKAAWKNLVESVGSGRADWLLKQVNPVNEIPVKTDENELFLIIETNDIIDDALNASIQNYWAGVWLAKGDAEAIQEVEDDLAAIGDAALIQKIKTEYIPLNFSDTVPDEIDVAHIKTHYLQLNTISEEELSQFSWNAAPEAKALPDRFTLIVESNGAKEEYHFPRFVKDYLPVGIDPQLAEDEQITENENSDLVFNEDLKWVTDFEEAIHVGMAIRIGLTAEQAAKGFDKIYVVGLRFTSDPQQGKQDLESLLSNHFQSQTGFGLIKQGTPTNNTDEAKSNYSWLEDPDESYERIFQSFIQGEADLNFTENVDGKVLADHLGITESLIYKVPNAFEQDQIEAKAMNKALLHTTIGYFMEEMLDDLFTDEQIQYTKHFFSEFVSGRGVVPAIRIGNQPYGILPVSAYSRMSFDISRNLDISRIYTYNHYLVDLKSNILKYNVLWSDLSSEATYVGKSGDPFEILMDILSLHPNSVTLRQRNLESQESLFNQANLVDATRAQDLNQRIEEKKTGIKSKLGFQANIQAPIFAKVLGTDTNKITGPWVDPKPVSEDRTLTEYTEGKNYLHWLSESNATTIKNQNFNGAAKPNALLYLLLRHSLLLNQASTVSNYIVQKVDKDFNKKLIHDQNFYAIKEVNTKNIYQDINKDSVLSYTAPGISGNSPVIDYLYSVNLLEARELAETVDAIKKLVNTSTAALERLLIEHLDCCSYRFDAWVTGMVNLQLKEQKRGQKEDGIYLGAYGWLLDVRPENKSLTPKRLDNNLSEIFNPDNDKVFHTDDKNLGYLHTPSLTQAVTAAILRNAYDTHKDSDTEKPFAIHLTSERVRQAQNILEGMRNGQSLTALLGCQFEKGLHDKYEIGVEADKFIYPLRMSFPLVANKQNSTSVSAAEIADVVNENQMDDATKAIEAIEANNVIDALRLIEHYENQTGVNKNYPFGLTSALFTFPYASNDAKAAINSEIERIIDINDAVADLLMAEQVFQVVQGNFDRAAAVADTLGKGKYPPEIEVVNTPRTGTNLTHRFTLHLNPSIPDDPVALAGSLPKVKAEPSLNAWLESVLPDLDKVECKVVFSSKKQENIPDLYLNLSKLGLSPLDCLYTIDLSLDKSISELDDRILYHIKNLPDYKEYKDLQIEIKYTEKAESSGSEIYTVIELNDFLRSIRKMLVGSKTLSAESFSLPTGEKNNTADFDVDDIIARLNGLFLDFNGVIDSLINTHDILFSLDKKLAEFKETLNGIIPPLDEVVISDHLYLLEEKLKLLIAQPKNSFLTTEIISDIVMSIPDVTELEIQSFVNELIDQLISQYYKLEKNDLTSISELFLQASSFDSTQAGISVFYQDLDNIYRSIFNKAEKLIFQWEAKEELYHQSIAEFTAAANEDEKIEALKRAEIAIARELTLAEDDTSTIYEIKVNDGFSDFSAVFIRLREITPESVDDTITVKELLEKFEALIPDMHEIDQSVPDAANETDSLSNDWIALYHWNNDIVTAIENLKVYFEEKKVKAEELKLKAEATEDPKEKTDLYIEAIKALFTENIIIVPKFSLQDGKYIEIENAYDNSDALLDFVKAEENRIFPVEDWLTGVARVREKIHHFEKTTILSNLFKPDVFLDPKPLQFPYAENDRWLAMKFKKEDYLDEDGNLVKDSFEVSGDKLIYTALFADSLPNLNSNKFCGIVIDEWTEVVPFEEETTGLMFHYDQPNTEPPQTMLLMVPPEINGNWNWNDLIDSLDETIELMKKRAVEPKHIDKTPLAQVLPATVLPYTKRGNISAAYHHIGSLNLNNLP